MNDTQPIVEQGPLKMRVVPELDGVRAIAVLIVFASHVGFGKVIPGGLGVTIFFFLSGYLITSLLYAEAATTGSINIKGFYVRRALRIFPPLYITLAVSALCVTTGVLIRHMDLTSIISQVLFFSNYDRMFEEFRGLPGPPLWSLAVEEHFYLLFPAAFCMFLMHIKPKNAFRICLIGCIFPLGFRVLSVSCGWDYTLSYYYTHTRADSILFGCALALWGNPVLQPDWGWKPKLGSFLVALAVLVIVTLIRGEMFGETLRYSFQGLALFVIFGYILSSHRWTSTVLNNVVLQAIGRVSYTFYLIHVLVFLIVAAWMPHSPRLFIVALTLAATLLYCWAMYVFVERPLADVRRRLHREPAPEPMAAPLVG